MSWSPDGSSPWSTNEGLLMSFSVHKTYPTANCTFNTSESCALDAEQVGMRTLIALLRMVFSMLSLIGSASIIISVIHKRQILNPKIHPIFMLSIADLLLAVMWIVGGAIWLSGGLQGPRHNKVTCFVVVLITVIVECVAINLTCVYAMLAYCSIKKKDFNNVYSLFEKDLDNHAWTARRTVTVYIFAWILPVVLVMVPFFVVAKFYKLLHESTSCSCRCIPYFGNIIPVANGRDNNTAYYMHDLSMLVASYGLVIAMNYLGGFIILVVIYLKILKLLKRMKAKLSQPKGGMSSASNVFAKGHSRAKQRVIYFLTSFVLTGFFNFSLSCVFVGFESKLLSTEVSQVKYHLHITPLIVLVYVLQSVSVPLQGFFNAIVYGWTREDFIQVIRPNLSSQTENSSLLQGKRPTTPVRRTHNRFRQQAPCDIQNTREDTDLLFSVDSEID